MAFPFRAAVNLVMLVQELVHRSCCSVALGVKFVPMSGSARNSVEISFVGLADGGLAVNRLKAQLRAV